MNLPALKSVPPTLFHFTQEAHRSDSYATCSLRLPTWVLDAPRLAQQSPGDPVITGEEEQTPGGGGALLVGLGTCSLGLVTLPSNHYLGLQAHHPPPLRARIKA